MVYFVIEQSGEIKEAFQYERLVTTQSYQALEEYARANYGADAVLREMTKDEEAKFIRYGSAAFHISAAFQPTEADQP